MIELIDVLDEAGNKTGRTANKDELHTEGLWHNTSHVWLVNSARDILLQYRAPHVRNFPNKWDISAAGHVSAGDTPLQAALRETEEELGLILQPEELELVGVVSDKLIFGNGVYRDNEHNVVYIARKDIDIGSMTMQQDELAGLKWVSLEEFKTLVETHDDSLVPHWSEYETLIKYLAK